MKQAITQLNELQFSGERHPELGKAQDALIAAEHVTRGDWLAAVEETGYGRCPICGSRIRTIESGTECTDGYCVSQFLP